MRELPGGEFKGSFLFYFDIIMLGIHFCFVLVNLLYGAVASTTARIAQTSPSMSTNGEKCMDETRKTSFFLIFFF